MSLHMTSFPDLVEMPAVQLREYIGTGELSPVEVLDAYVARIHDVNPFVNALAATSFNCARKLAKDAEKAVLLGRPLGMLHGLPIGVKDLEPPQQDC